MKYALDLDQLCAEGKITPEECLRLKGFAHRGTGALAVRIIFVFGAIAVAIASFLLLPNSIQSLFREFFRLIFATPNGHLLLIALCGALGFILNSGFLASSAALAIFGFIGSSTSYWHATYELSVPSPVITVLVFGALSAAGLWLTAEKGKLPRRYERPCVIFSRACLFFCNMGFWVGSLWGGGRDADFWRSHPTVSPELFSVAWAFALAGGAVVATRMNRQAMLNIVAVFGGIHFYTQYFEHLGADPATLLFGGVLLLVSAWGLMKMNKLMNERRRKTGNSFPESSSGADQPPS